MKPNDELSLKMKAIKQDKNQRKEEENDPYSSDYLRSSQVQSMLGISRSTIFIWQKKKDFPASVNIGGRLALFRKKDITDWVESYFKAQGKA